MASKFFIASKTTASDKKYFKWQGEKYDDKEKCKTKNRKRYPQKNYSK